MTKCAEKEWITVPAAAKMLGMSATTFRDKFQIPTLREWSRKPLVDVLAIKGHQIRVLASDIEELRQRHTRKSA